MKNKHQNTLISISIAVVSLITFIGAVTLIIQLRTTNLIITEILALGVSVAALALAILAGLHNASEARMLGSVVKDLQITIKELRDINHDNEQIKYKLAKDYAVDRKIADALLELGLGEDDAHRNSIAGHIKTKIQIN